MPDNVTKKILFLCEQRKPHKQPTLMIDQVNLHADSNISMKLAIVRI